MNIIITFLTIIIIILIGYITKRIGIFKIKDVIILNKIVVNLAMPCLIFYSIYTTKLNLLHQLGIISIVGILTSIIIGLISYFIFTLMKINTQKKWALLILIMIGNSGFIGFPLISGIFGNTGLLRAIFFNISDQIMLIVLYIILVLRFNGKLKDIVKKIVTFPILWALILSLTLNLLHIQIGSIVLNTITLFKNITIPLILLSLGISIKFKGITKDLNLSILSSIIKLIIYPLTCLLILIILNIRGLEFKISIIEASMSSLILLLSYSIEFNLDYKLTSNCIIISTLLSFITLPLILLIL